MQLLAEINISLHLFKVVKSKLLREIRIQGKVVFEMNYTILSFLLQFGSPFLILFIGNVLKAM